MAEIHEFVSVRCPFDRASTYLERFFRLLPSDGDAGVLSLRVHLADLVIEHDVDVKLGRAREIPAFTVLDIEWDPKNDGPYPHFTGTLTASDEAVGWSRIDLDGEYKPPLGPVGAAFDAAFGHGIAVKTAQELLARLKSELENSDKTEHPGAIGS